MVLQVPVFSDLGIVCFGSGSGVCSFFLEGGGGL